MYDDFLRDVCLMRQYVCAHVKESRSSASAIEASRDCSVNDANSRSMAGQQSRRTNKRSLAKSWILPGIVIAATAIGSVTYSHLETDVVANTGPATLPQVIVSKPLVRELDSRLGFLGQFSAVDRVELRAQVGGTLTGIHFKDEDILRKGDLLFTIDSRPYEINLAQANASPAPTRSRSIMPRPCLDRARCEVLAALRAQNLQVPAGILNQPPQRRPIRSTSKRSAGCPRPSNSATSLSSPTAEDA
jgi:multidrug efflux pump subunit AcrA (membrane-fusion protein)